MFRNRRNCSDTIVSEATRELNGSVWLAAIRSVIFNFVFFISLPLMMIVNLPSLLIKKPPYYFSKFASSYSLWLVKLICGLEYKVVGLENVPKEACIFASKHQSAWDTIIYLALYPDAAYVLKQELTQIPVYGHFIKKFGMIAIDRKRGRKAILDLKAQAQNIINQNRNIVIFPEGSRTSPGTTQAYQKGVLALYKDIHCPIVPVALNSGLYWGRRSWIKWPGVITLQFLAPMKENLESDAFMEDLTHRIETASKGLLEKR